MSAEGSTKAVMAALLANLGIAVTKLFAWMLTGASSMLAEAIHSLVDSANQLLLLWGNRRATKPADAQHPFGYGRARYLYAFVVSIVLFTLGGVFALYEAWHKAEAVRAGEPDELLESEWWWVPLLVLAAAMVMEGLSLRTAVQESNKVRGRQSWVAFIRRAKAPELPVVLLEDAAALLGLAFAFLGISLALVTEDGIYDAIGTMMIGLLLVAVAVVLAVEMGSLLVGEGASRPDDAAIRAALLDSGDVARVIHQRTLYLAPDNLLLGAKIELRVQTLSEATAAIDAAEARVRAAVPVARTIFLEPDAYRDAAAAEADLPAERRSAPTRDSE